MAHLITFVMAVNSSTPQTLVLASPEYVNSAIR